MARLLFLLAITVTLGFCAPNQKLVIPCLGLLDPQSTDPEPCKGPEMWAAHQQWTPMRKRACGAQDPLLDKAMCDYLNGLKPVDMNCFAMVTNAYYKLGYPPPCPKSVSDSLFDHPVTSMSDDEGNICVKDAWNMFNDLCHDNPDLLDRTRKLYDSQMQTLDKCVASNPDIGATCKHEFELQQVAQFNVFQNKEDGSHADPMTILVRSIKTFKNFYDVFIEYKQTCEPIWTCGFKNTYAGLQSSMTKFAYNCISKHMEESNGTLDQDEIVARMQVFAASMMQMSQQGKSS